MLDFSSYITILWGPRTGSNLFEGRIRLAGCSLVTPELNVCFFYGNIVTINSIRLGTFLNIVSCTHELRLGNLNVGNL